MCFYIKTITNLNKDTNLPAWFKNIQIVCTFTINLTNKEDTYIRSFCFIFEKKKYRIIEFYIKLFFASPEQWCFIIRHFNLTPSIYLCFPPILIPV